jgi:hypothetical protein
VQRWTAAGAATRFVQPGATLRANSTPSLLLPPPPRPVQDERRHIFDVIKINMFGFKQARVVVVERGSSAPTTKISICTAAGEARGGHLPPSLNPCLVCGCAQASHAACWPATR